MGPSNPLKIYLNLWRHPSPNQIVIKTWVCAPHMSNMSIWFIRSYPLDRCVHLNVGPTWGPTWDRDPGDQKISLGPTSLQKKKKISLVPKCYHLHLVLTSLTLYSSFEWVCSWSNGPVHLDGCRTRGPSEILGGGGSTGMDHYVLRIERTW